ncbi:MAG: iron-sulfur cluster assembly protein, partial [Prochlorotrichaceae cyanobacterium]
MATDPPGQTQAKPSESDPRFQEVLTLLKQIIEPILHNDIVSLGMVRNLRVVNDYVYLRLYIGSHQQDLTTQVEQ